MNKKNEKIKEFGVAKWIIFPLLTLALSGILIWFNVSVFGAVDSIPYIVMIVAIGGFSIMIGKYTSSAKRHIRITAFCIEILLSTTLAVSGAYCFSVQREMLVANEVSKNQESTIAEIAKLDRRAQRNIAKNFSFSTESKSSVFKEYERFLFWLMIGEFFAYMIGAFTLLGMTHIYIEDSETSESSMNNSETSMNYSETSMKLPEHGFASFELQPSRGNFQKRKAGSEKVFNEKNSDQWFSLYASEKGTRVYNEHSAYQGFIKPGSEPASLNYESIRKFIAENRKR